MKRIFLFLFTNFAILMVLSIAYHLVANLLGVDAMNQLSREGINLPSLLVYSAVFGFGGAIISLLMSKQMAKWMTRATVVDGTENQQTAWLVQTVTELSNLANIKTPEVAIYEGSANAFATGAFKNSALVAVSSEIMEQMSKRELRAVIGHEIAHVANGDMVTLTLVQGILNMFVILASRVLGYLADKFIFKTEKGYGLGYYIVLFVSQILFGIAASLIVMAFSRHREFAADAGSSNLMGSPQDMIDALKRLNNLEPGVLPDSLKAMGINDKPSVMNLFSSHPPIDKRIEALEKSRGMM